MSQHIMIRYFNVINGLSYYDQPSSGTVCLHCRSRRTNHPRRRSSSATTAAPICNRSTQPYPAHTQVICLLCRSSSWKVMPFSQNVLVLLTSLFIPPLTLCCESPSCILEAVISLRNTRVAMKSPRARMMKVMPSCLRMRG